MRADHRDRTEMHDDNEANVEDYEESRGADDEDDIAHDFLNHMPATSDDVQQRGRRSSRDTKPTNHCINDQRRRHSALGNGNTPTSGNNVTAAVSQDDHRHSVHYTERCHSDPGSLSSENRARLNTRTHATGSLIIPIEDRDDTDYPAK